MELQGGGGVKNLNKWVTSFMDGPYVYYHGIDFNLHFTKNIKKKW